MTNEQHDPNKLSQYEILYLDWMNQTGWWAVFATFIGFIWAATVYCLEADHLLAWAFVTHALIIPYCIWKRPGECPFGEEFHD